MKTERLSFDDGTLRPEELWVAKKGVLKCEVPERPVRASEQGAKRSVALELNSPANHISSSHIGPFQSPFAPRHKEMSSKIRQQLNESGFVIVQHLLFLWLIEYRSRDC